MQVPLVTAAKTVADCFEHRNELGLDVPVEALREYRWKFGAGREERRRFAKVCRVERVLRP